MGDVWHESDTPFDLVLAGADQVSLAADGLIHAGIEVYAVRDEHALASLIGPDGPDEAKLRADASRAIAASALATRPELARPPAPGPAHALELLEFRTVELPDPSRPVAIPLGPHQGLRLVCARAGRRVAAVPVATGPLSFVLARAGTDLAGLAARGAAPDPEARAWLVVDGRLRAGEPIGDGSLRWRGAGSNPGPALAVARSGDDWALARIPAEAEPPTTLALFAFGSGRPGSPLDLIATDGPGLLALAGGAAGTILARRAVGVNGGHARFVPLSEDLALRPLAFDRSRIDRPIAPTHSSTSRPGARPLAAITVEVAFVPREPIEGEAIRVDLEVRDAAGELVAAFDVVPLDRGNAPSRAGQAGLLAFELGPRGAGTSEIALEIRLDDGSAIRVAERLTVLPATGVAVSAIPEGTRVVAPGTPLALRVRSRHTGEHSLRMVRANGDVVERIAVDPARTRVAYFYPRARGEVRLELVAPTGEVARTGTIAIGDGPGTTDEAPSLLVGHATIGRPWPIVVTAPVDVAALAIVDRVDPPAVAVVRGGTSRGIDGLAPARPFRARPRASLNLPHQRLVAELPVAPEAGGTLPMGERRGELVAFSEVGSQHDRVRAPAKESAPWIVRARSDERSLYRVAHRLVDLWCFQASAALAAGDHRGAASLAGRVLASYPEHPAARGILVQARRARELKGEVAPRTPLERLRAVRLHPRWIATPLVAAVAEIRDLAGVPIALELPDPHQPVTFEPAEVLDGDTLVRRLMGELGLKYRVRGDEIVIEDGQPTPSPGVDSARKDPSTVLWIATFRSLDPAPARATPNGAVPPLPPGAWRAWLFPPGGGLPEWRDLDDPDGGRVAGVIPAFLRPGDRARARIVAPAAGARAVDTLALASEPPSRGVSLAPGADGAFLEILAPTDGVAFGRLARGGRALEIAIPVVGNAPESPSIAAIHLERGTPIEVEGPGTLVIDPDRLSWLLRQLDQAPAPTVALDAARKLVVQQIAAERSRRWLAAQPRGHEPPALDGRDALAVEDAIPLAADPAPIADLALALALASASGRLPPAILAERVTTLRLGTVVGSAALDPASRAAAFWALAANTQARTLTPAVPWEDLGPVDVEHADVVTVARLARAAHVRGDRERARAFAARLERAAVRDERGDARFDAPGANGALATQEAAAALLEHDVASPAGQAAASAMMRAPAGPPAERWAALEAIARSIPEAPGAQPTRVIRLILDERTTALPGSNPGRAVELSLGPGRHVIALGPGMRPASAELRRASQPTVLDARWEIPGPVSLGGLVHLAASIPPDAGGARTLVIPLPPGSRARLAWTGEARYDAERGELILALGPDEVKVEVEVRVLVPGRYVVPGAIVRGGGGETMLAAPGAAIDVIAPPPR